MSNCQKYLELAERKLDGAISQDESRELEVHLRGCATCRRECQILEGADALMRLDIAPALQDNEWPELTGASIDVSTENLPFPADALRPPDVSDGEWDNIWNDIERESLLGESAEGAPGTVQRSIPRRRILPAFAAVAAAVLVGFVVVAYFLYSPVDAPQPELLPDIVSVAPGYVSSRLEMDDGSIVHTISFEPDVSNTGAETAEHYFYNVSETNVIEIVGSSGLSRSRAASGEGYLFKRTEKDGESVVEIVAQDDARSAATGSDELSPPDDGDTASP